MNYFVRSHFCMSCGKEHHESKCSCGCESYRMSFVQHSPVAQNVDSQQMEFAF